MGAQTYEPGQLAANICARMMVSLPMTFGEDKVVVVAQQASLDRVEAPLVMMAPDAGLVHARRLVAAMIESERVTAA